MTARHTIDNIRDTGLNEIWLRWNLLVPNIGHQWIATKIDDWVMHEDGPTVDVAVYPMMLSNMTDHMSFPMESAVTDAVCRAEDIGVGTDVYVTGLFAHHFGNDRNIPIVRVGNIAAMREEGVASKLGKLDAYLIESRSIGGLSGSPVFANPDRIRLLPGGQWKVRHSFFLLGLIHGHYDSPDDLIADAANNDERINVGIAMVVPAEKIIQVLNHPRIREYDGKWIRKFNLPAPD